MRRFLIILVALLLLALTTHAADNRHARLARQPVAAQPTTSRVAWYSRSEAPQGWIQLGTADMHEQLTFTLIVKGSNKGELERRFWSRSNPDSEEFGQWMTNAEIEQLVAPSAAELQQLYSTLAEHGISAGQVVSHGDSFDIHATVEQASSLFATRFHHFKHSATRMDAIRQWGDYSLPAAIAAQAELILGVHTFPTIEQRVQMRARRNAARTATAAHLSTRRDSIPAWVPQALAAVYGIPYPIAPLVHANISAGVIEWEGETFSPTDLVSFSNYTATPVVPVDAHHIVGNDSVADPGEEASLDIQWLEGLNPGATPWFWLVDQPYAWMYNFTVQFLNSTDFPSVISMSYGVPELYNCDAFGPDNDCNGVSYQQYQAIVDGQFMKMGLLGVTIVSANSDNGIYNLRADGDHNLGADVFLPNYPGTSLYVTTVGATEMANQQYNLTNPPPACSYRSIECISSGDEQAVSLAIAGFLSGGGFSNVTLRPGYQSAAVDAYLNSGVKLPDESLWNRSGRAIPDVTAQGFNGFIVNGDNPDLVSGTSMSTPIVAAVLSLLSNDFYQITNSTLGFANPLLFVTHCTPHTARQHSQSVHRH